MFVSPSEIDPAHLAEIIPHLAAAQESPTLFGIPFRRGYGFVFL
jgi:hypothetical protein